MKTILKCVLGICALATMNANATLVSVSPGLSSFGSAAAIISAPSSATNSVAFNSAQQGFNERQGVTLGAALGVDGGTLAAGLVVDSHMIFLNKQNGVSGTLSHTSVAWTFSGTILGIMTDVNGALESASTSILGAVGTTYSTFSNRGFEGADTASFAGNTLTVSMIVTQPGDWIRVVTAHVPEPFSFALMSLGLLGLGFVRRVKS